MTGKALSPAIKMAVRLLAMNETLSGALCHSIPKSVEDIDRVRLGEGRVGARGGEFVCTRAGTALCIAYDVDGQLLITRPSGLPMPVSNGQRAIVGPLVFGLDGQPHGD